MNNATNREAGALFLLLWTKAVVRTTVSAQREGVI